jgi:hypothetical protein
MRVIMMVALPSSRIAGCAVRCERQTLNYLSLSFVMQYFAFCLRWMHAGLHVDVDVLRHRAWSLDLALLVDLPTPRVTDHQAS